MPEELDNEAEQGFREDFVRRFAEHWHAQGGPRSEGRILGYLLVADAEAVSAEQIAEGAGVSRGSVSQAVRRLRKSGFVDLVETPGERTRRVTVDEDVWGGFLRNERAYLQRQKGLAADALRLLPGLGASARARLRNMHDYMTWMDDHHDALLARWEEYKAARDTRPDGP
ncbi:MarR family transcriptional regulator [Nocardiopsis sp. N85]|uniref:GbsR/MarR family transcriptional regulator n=1 Tax=Nocardiopsis sp. N85 TaxID=3029400 RepID=UPI00237FB4F3|nr:MarR family transcriptional regulator [Nocardiopsis sp. N85]MDE3725255.1 MarR family transcriptional regulator [Nocardiopsis sp. N85]